MNIGGVPVNANNLPLTPVTIDNLRILDLIIGETMPALGEVEFEPGEALMFYVEAYAYISPLVFQWYIDDVLLANEDQFVLEYTFNTGGSHLVTCVVSSDDYSHTLSWQLTSSTQVPEISAPDSNVSFHAIYPNPASSKIYLSYETDRAAMIDISVYNLKGQKVSSIVNAPRPKGMHLDSWNPLSTTGNNIPAGVYIISITSGDRISTRKVLIH